MARCAAGLKRSWVSALAPSARLLCLLILVSGLFAESGPVVLTLMVLGVLALFSEGLGPRALLPELLPLSFLLLFTFALETFSMDGSPHFVGAEMPKALLDAARLLAAFVLARLFYQSTTASELREAAESLGRLLPGSLGQDAALALSLVLGFIPAILLEWRLSLEAGKARGLHRRSGFSPSVALVAAFIGRILATALLLPEILLARGWTGLERKGRPWGLEEILSVALSAGVTGLGLLGMI